MTVIALCCCLKALKMSEHPGSVAIHSHEIECSFVVAIIQSSQEVFWVLTDWYHWDQLRLGLECQSTTARHFARNG